MSRDLHDHYFREAKREGYLSRAAYKLIEIDARKRVLRSGDRVLDCGAAPGSWLQVAARRVGDRGHVVGIDLKPITLPAPMANVTVLTGDLREVDDEMLRPPKERPFDVLLSDMAPDTTGDQTIDHHGSMRLCHVVLDRCPTLLRTGANLVMKAFEGEAYPELLERARAEFESARGYKPKASRAISREMFVVASGYRGASSRPQPSPRAPKPTRGWGRE